MAERFLSPNLNSARTRIYSAGCGLNQLKIQRGNSMVKVTIDDSVHDARGNGRWIDLLNRIVTKLAQGCYPPQLGPIQTCHACLVETNGQLVRACGTDVSDGMTVWTKSAQALEAQRQAFDRILSNHVLYCTVCDNNNGNCTIHNTVKMMAIEHQSMPYKKKPYELDM